MSFQSRINLALTPVEGKIPCRKMGMAPGWKRSLRAEGFLICPLPARAEGPVKVEGGADQREMRKRLREVPQGFTR